MALDSSRRRKLETNKNKSDYDQLMAELNASQEFRWTPRNQSNNQISKMPDIKEELNNLLSDLPTMDDEMDENDLNSTNNEYEKLMAELDSIWTPPKSEKVSIRENLEQANVQNDEILSQCVFFLDEVAEFLYGGFVFEEISEPFEVIDKYLSEQQIDVSIKTKVDKLKNCLRNNDIEGYQNARNNIMHKDDIIDISMSF